MDSYAVLLKAALRGNTVYHAVFHFVSLWTTVYHATLLLCEFGTLAGMHLRKFFPTTEM